MITLLPNFGAEEGDEGAVANRPELQDAALLWRELFPGGTQVIGVDDAPPLLGHHDGPAFSWLPASGGVPWLSTQPAERRLARLGQRLAAASPDVVRRVHDKGFAQRVAAARGLNPLGDRVRVFDPDELSELPAAVAALPRGTEWAIKPRLGSSGRGRVPLAAVAGALPRLAKRGGAVLEPWLDRLEDLSVQLHITPAGAVELLGSTRQILTPSGVYLGNSCVVDDRPRAGTPWDPQLERAAMELGAAAAAEGYFGPCGVDAFVFRDEHGAPVLRPIVEFNARFTMGTVALGLLRRLEERGESPRRFTFALRDQPAGRRVPLVGSAAVYLD